jgi:hypothetical protein
MVRSSPSIPDRARVLPILSVGASIDRIGLIFERDGRFRTATNLLRTRIASYQREGAQSHLEFFLAAVGENRGRREPAEMIKGAFVMPTWDEGMFSTSVFGDSAISQGTALSTLVGFVEKAMQGYV